MSAAEKRIHEPLNPARKSFPEYGFLCAWQEYVGRERDPESDATHPIDDIFKQYTVVWGFDQRAASVAASFVMWLGTNCGAGFLHTAARRIAQGGFISRGDAYLASWAIENQRHRGLNHGLRTIEHVLAPVEGDSRVPCGLLTRTGYDAPDLGITQADAEVIDCVLIWLGTREGRAFLTAAEARTRAHMTQVRAVELGARR